MKNEDHRRFSLPPGGANLKAGAAIVLRQVVSHAVDCVAAFVVGGGGGASCRDGV